VRRIFKIDGLTIVAGSAVSTHMEHTTSRNEYKANNKSEKVWATAAVECDGPMDYTISIYILYIYICICIEIALYIYIYTIIYHIYIYITVYIYMYKLTYSTYPTPMRAIFFGLLVS